MPEDIFSIQDKVVIVTGGGRGIGKVLADAMAKRQAYVYCFDIEFPEKSSSEFKNNLFEIAVDITNENKVQASCEQIYQTHARIDALVNNAGITLPGKQEDHYSLKNWQRTLNINLTASFICSQTVLEYMKKNAKGSIINITSLNAEMAFPQNPAYIASKGGLKMLGKSFAKDWGKYGIRVNNLGPGYIKTAMTQASYENEHLRKSREARTLLNRWGEPQDLVGPAIFLVSDASQYITAQDLYIDGGWLANGL